MSAFGMTRGNAHALMEDSRAHSKNCLIAVMRTTPNRFSIEHFVSTGKSTGDSHHGMHISSDSRGKCSSISSRNSLPEYDIWRSWEDCLWFQDSLEVEYERAAREKKKRLAQGKGVKGFDGNYKKDLAASWDSLPAGPEPRSVAQNIHDHLPTLTRKGTLFRASQLTIDRRQAELIAFIRALFSDDMPALIKEIRVTSIVSDFFGLWRSDFDIEQESRTLKSSTNNLFSSYFSASHLSLPSSDIAPRDSPSKVYRKSVRSSTRSTTSLSSLETCGSRRSRLSTSSDSSSLSECGSDTSSLYAPSIPDNLDPIVLGHSPSDQFNPILEVLPEEQETPKLSEPYRGVNPKPGASAKECKPRRSNSFFGLLLRKPSERFGNRSVRESWQTTQSQDSTVNEVLDGLRLVLPHPIKEQKFRASIASVLTNMTTDSADAVIPQTPQGSEQISTSVSPSGADSKSSVPEALPCSVSSISESLEALEADDLSVPASPSSTRTAFNCPPSPAYTSTSIALTTTSSLIPADSICIKAIHGASIILLRVSRRIGFEEVKQRLYEKFTNQEGISLSQTYSVVFVPPVSSPSAKPVTSAVRTDVQEITLDSDWEQLMSTVQGNKITLRIQDN